MDLYIVRHAWAGHYGDPQWPDDFERPLSSAGKERFAEFAEKLAGRGFLPQLVATSPLVRCRQTAELVVDAVEKAGQQRPRLVEVEALVPGGDFDELIEWSKERAKEFDSMAWVGHAPGVGRMTAALIGGRGEIRFAKGAVAAVRFPLAPEQGNGELRWLLTAKMLGC
ncbi:MAG: histidine phosphatase family protein [Pirellulales bacterium]|nr:histidine phosphatase family protein [Pirellulales bacterium]